MTADGISDRLERIEARLAGLEQALGKAVDALGGMARRPPLDQAGIEQAIARVAQNEARQAEARAVLEAKLDLGQPLPLTRGWAGSPDFLLHVFDHILQYRPRTVVELGSGVSTVVVAAALQRNGTGHVHSLDHLPRYAEATRHSLAGLALDGVASVHLAPLVPWHPPQETPLGIEWRWYDTAVPLESVPSIDLLLIDGPPEGTGPHARYPAIPALRERMPPDSVVLLDDARRPQEREACEAWASAWAMRLELRPDFEKGLAILVAD